MGSGQRVTQIGRAFGRALRACAGIWALTFLAVLSWTYLWPMDRPAPTGDVIVCLSGGGDVPRATPEGVLSRAEACDRLYDANAAPDVLFTGGALRSNLPSSAATMARATDIPDEDVLIEPLARSTLQNALFSLPLLDPGDRLVLVTEAYHLPRAWLSFRLMGARDVALHASARVVEKPDGRFFERHPILRESLAIWFNLARVVGFRLGGWIGVPDNTRVAWLH